LLKCLACEMSFYLRRGCHPASVGEGRCSVYRVVVRAKKDADAVRAMLSRYYGGWDVEVVTLGGVREPEKAAERLAELADGSNYVIVLLGRDDTPLAELAARAPPTAVFKQLKYAKVRNSRLMALHAELEKARAALRNCVGWTGSAYVLSPRAVPLFDSWDPAYDVFIGLGEGFRARLEELVGPVGENPLLVRMRAGLHEVYSGPSLAARLRFPDEGLPSGQRVGSEPVDVELGELVKANEAVIKAHERVVARIPAGRGTGADEVFVPLSGGKDSSAALALAVKAFGAKRVTAVYVDTGVDFPQNPEYVRGLAAKLGVKLEVARAPVLEELPSRGLPTHGTGRWCTGLKLEASALGPAEARADRVGACGRRGGSGRGIRVEEQEAACAAGRGGARACTLEAVERRAGPALPLEGGGGAQPSLPLRLLPARLLPVPGAERVGAVRDAERQQNSREVEGSTFPR